MDRVKGISSQLHPASSEMLEFRYLQPQGIANNMVSSNKTHNLQTLLILLQITSCTVVWASFEIVCYSEAGKRPCVRALNWLLRPGPAAVHTSELTHLKSFSLLWVTPSKPGGRDGGLLWQQQPAHHARMKTKSGFRMFCKTFWFW